MLSHPPPRPSAAIRRIGVVPWDHDGCQRLTIWAREEVPTFDDSILRGVLARCAHVCLSLRYLDRALNRELWPLGYVALIEAASKDDPVAHVVIAGNR